MSFPEADDLHSIHGRLGRTYHESEPRFPQPRPAEGPNVVVILFDDVGFADFGCYGSELHTPNLDVLAEGGHRYNNFHTTTLCSPSRACLLTGRNHHSVGMRMLSNVDSGWPSGRGRITRQAALISEVLRDAGYNTFAVGKWHIAPMREASAAGPFDEWPLGRGFNQFYGFLNGATDHFYPELIRDNHSVAPPATPEQGYHLTDDLIDQAISYVSDHVAHRPEGPFFLYLPLGAAHTPHHAPADYLEAVRGRYDAGWDAIRRERYERQLATGVIPPGTDLPPQNPDVPSWDSLRPDEQRVAARLQEAYAAFIEHTDAALGRLLEFLKRSQQWDDTLLIVTSDNGAAMEGGRLGAFSRIRFFNDMEEDFDRVLGSLDEIGGPQADSHYARGWAQASNTPLRWYKYHTHGGGVRDPLIVSWPGRLAHPGSVLDQFHHIIDLAPTIYEAVGIEPPDTLRGIKQMPVHGASLAYTFSDPDASPPQRTQYFEMFGNRGVWADGWKAVTHHQKGAEYTDAEWELYHLDRDFSESDDLADYQPDKLRELVELWWLEAGRYDVLPLDDRSVELFRAPPIPGSPQSRARFDYYPPVSHIEPSVAPPLEHASRHQIKAEISGEKRGVIVGYGNTASGFVLYADEGMLRYEYNAAGDVTFAELALPTEEVVNVVFEFQLNEDRTARGRLHANDLSGEWFHLPRALTFLALSGMDIGHNPLSPISSRYVSPFVFEGHIERVTILLDQPNASPPKPLDD
ncbi:MAG: arylsulfatase [Anaerolineales bacterium]